MCISDKAVVIDGLLIPIVTARSRSISCIQMQLLHFILSIIRMSWSFMTSLSCE